jgi:acid phosphatase (class A)
MATRSAKAFPPPAPLFGGFGVRIHEVKRPKAQFYPSGHSSLAFSMGVVLASLIPEKSQAILARASEYAEHRLVCGVHYRSDIVAGQQFGTILALRLMQNPTFRAQMDRARAEFGSATH